MTQRFRSEPKVGDTKTYKGIRMIYGPDPWAWNVSFNCWFNLDLYIKENGRPPSYVSTS